MFANHWRSISDQKSCIYFVSVKLNSVNSNSKKERKTLLLKPTLLKISKAIHKKKELAIKKQFIKLWITVKIKSEIPIKSSSYFQVILSKHTYKIWLWGFQILIFKIFEKFTEILQTIIFCLVMILYILGKY